MQKVNNAEKAEIVINEKTANNKNIKSKEKYDVIVVGAGPSSIFMAYELIQLHKDKRILLIEQGR